MKNIFLIIILCLLTLQVKAQQIIPIEDLGSYKHELSGGEKIPDETYFKDVNNLLNDYKGIWVGTYNNNSYIINISKITKGDFLNYKADQLIMNFQVKNDNGQVIRSTKANLVEHATLPPSGLGFKRNNVEKYEFSYSGPSKSSACGDGGIIVLESKNNGGELHLNIIPRRDIIYGPYCPDGSIKPPFPKPDEPPMVLTKQHIPKKKIGN